MTVVRAVEPVHLRQVIRAAIHRLILHPQAAPPAAEQAIHRPNLFPIVGLEAERAIHWPNLFPIMGLGLEAERAIHWPTLRLIMGQDPEPAPAARHR